MPVICCRWRFPAISSTRSGNGTSRGDGEAVAGLLRRVRELGAVFEIGHGAAGRTGVPARFMIRPRVA